MSNFDQLILSFNSRIGHEKDLAFPKNNGEIGNRIQEKFSPVVGNERGGWQIALDDEGDISIGTPVGSWYVTEDAVFLVGFISTQGDLTHGTCGDQVAPIFELLMRERHPLRPTSYQVGVLFTARFYPPGPAALRSQFTASVFDSIFRTGTPTETSTLRVSSTFSKEPFSDSVELEVSGRDFQLRCARQSPASEFESYRDFLVSADMGAMIAGFQPLIELMMADETVKLRGRVFKSDAPG